MRSFGIVDTSKRNAKPCAVLRYDEDRRAYAVTLEPWATEDNVPMTFVPFVRAGQRELGPRWSRTWVEERVVPPSRQNIGQVLKANGLQEYDDFALLVAARGRSSQDDFELVELFGDGTAPGDPEASPHEGAAAIGRELAGRRRLLGVTQRELAAATGVQQAVISRVESGRANPTVGLLEDLARGLGATLRLTLE